MKLITILLFATTLCFGQLTVTTVNSSAKDNPSLELFGNKLLECFRNNDRSTFKTLLVSVNQMQKGIETQIADTAKKRIWLNKNSHDGPINYPKYNEISINSLDKIIKTGIKDNLDWSKIKYVDFKFRTKETAKEFKDIQGKLEYSYEGKTYSVFITTAIYLVDSWYICLIKANAYNDQN